jgi:glycerol-3-phosphate dehydrogenase
MNRNESLYSLAHAGVVDLAIVGGGATGLGVALDAALRGYSVALLESHDFAGGTSSRSTKLLHGGVRYLAQGNVALVREALHERQSILAIAPHLAAPLSFVMPAYAWWKLPFYTIGLKLYDLLAGRAGLGATEWLSRRETAQALPGVQVRGLHGGVRYWDAQFDDARLALAIAHTARAAGANVLNHVKVANLQALEGQSDGAKWALDWQNQRGVEQGVLRAKCVVNAAGVWVDDVLAKVKGHVPTRRIVTPSQGVHLVVDRRFLAGKSALLVPKTTDGRVLFAVPWLGSLILGTTDTVRDDAPREPLPLEQEIDFILREAAHVLADAPQRADVRSVWVGLRPLVSPSSQKATRSISREHTIVVSDQGLVTVTGGKWTTYRAMATDVMAQIESARLLPSKPVAQTDEHQLVGGGQPSGSDLTEAPGIHLFGDRAPVVSACVGSDKPLALGLTEAMVRYAVRSEFALTVEDVLARRWRALFLDARVALAIAPRVAEIITEETGQDADLLSFQKLCQQYVLNDRRV